MQATDPTTGEATVAATVVWTTRRLRACGVDSPERDSRRLVAAATGLSRAALLAHPQRLLSEEEQRRLAALVERRARREPVARILGWRGFYGREFEITPSTLEPRQDTETVIDAALQIAREEGWRAEPVRIIDVGTGTGCLLVTLLTELPNAFGLGTDITPDVLRVADRNARRHGVAARARWTVSESLRDIEEKFDLLVSNPPYIRSDEIDFLPPEVRFFDPRTALDGGPDGLRVYREIIADLERVVPQGWALFEVGLGQAPAVVAMLREAKDDGRSCAIRTFRDLEGHERCVAWRARRQVPREKLLESG
jgi:release factor glutamine methyltransferase